MFGTSHLYVFHHPAEVESSSLKQADITYEMAQEEIAKNAGLDVDDQESKGDFHVVFEGRRKGRQNWTSLKQIVIFFNFNTNHPAWPSYFCRSYVVARRPGRSDADGE